MDQRSRDSKISRRSCDVAIELKGRDVPDFEMLDAKIASALKEIISNSNFRRRVSVQKSSALRNMTEFYEGGKLLV